MKPCKRHPERPARCRGLCESCYSLWRYHNAPGRKQAVIASVARYQARVGRFRAKPEISVVSPVKNGVRALRKNILSFSRTEDASLDACIRRRGLVRRPWMSRWRQAA